MKNSHPLISVIIPIYNQDTFIGRCLRSILLQTMSQSDYEIIVINDASTDRTSYALELFHDRSNQSFQCIKVITSKINLGHFGL